MSENYMKFYINGAWVDPAPGSSTFDVIHPGNEEAVATIAMGSQADVDKAVAAARTAVDRVASGLKKALTAVLDSLDIGIDASEVG